MEVTRETKCPKCSGELVAWGISGVEVTLLSCTICELDGVVGDDRFLDARGKTSQQMVDLLTKRAERLKQFAKEAKGRYTEVKP